MIPPCSSTHLSRVSTRTSGDSIACGDSKRPREQRLLIVDVQTMIGKTLNTIFTIQGYDVITVESAFSGLKIAETWVPDLVIAEMILASVNGLDFAKRLVAIHRNCKVILLAAVCNLELVHEACHRGFDFFEKPVAPKVLIERAKELLVGLP